MPSAAGADAKVGGSSNSPPSPVGPAAPAAPKPKAPVSQPAAELMRRQTASAEASRKRERASTASALAPKKTKSDEALASGGSKAFSREPTDDEVAKAMERVLAKASAPLSLAQVALSVKSLLPSAMWNLAKWVAAVRSAKAVKQAWFADVGEDMLSLKRRVGETPPEPEAASAPQMLTPQMLAAMREPAAACKAIAPVLAMGSRDGATSQQLSALQDLEDELFGVDD